MSGARVAWFNCAAGVAGDMLLGALVDAGADPDEITAAVAGLGLADDVLRFERVQRGGVSATLAVVTTGHDHDRHDDHHDHDDHDRHDHPHRPAREVFALLGSADLPDRVRHRALATYRLLAEVEGEIHDIPTDDVELHEVGAIDAIVDVVGTCAALESLGVERVTCSPIPLGTGTVRAAHGTLPNPAPAVVRLLARGAVPAVGIDTTMELSTPTGVALLVALADHVGAIPPMTVQHVGFGAGTADPDGRPNVVNVVVGAGTSVGPGAIGTGRRCRRIETNVDDATPEVLAHTVARLLDAGAHDAWVTPIVMKKGRPAHTVHALCDDALAQRVTAVLARETGSLGIRASSVERWPRRREERTVDLDGHAVRVKVTDDRVKVEHDDAVAAADALDLPLREVLRRAEAAARAATTDGAPG